MNLNYLKSRYDHRRPVFHFITEQKWWKVIFLAKKSCFLQHHIDAWKLQYCSHELLVMQIGLFDRSGPVFCTVVLYQSSASLSSPVPVRYQSGPQSSTSLVHSPDSVHQCIKIKIYQQNIDDLIQVVRYSARWSGTSPAHHSAVRYQPGPQHRSGPPIYKDKNMSTRYRQSDNVGQVFRMVVRYQSSLSLSSPVPVSSAVQI